MKRSRYLWATVLMALLFAALFSLTASAEETPIYAVLDMNGEVKGIGYALGSNRGETVFLCPDLDNRLLAVNINDETTMCDLRKESSESGYFGYYTISDWRGNIVHYLCGSPRADDLITIAYLDNSDVKTITARVTKEYESQGSNAKVLLSCQNSSRLKNSNLMPWIAFSSEGQCIGVVYLDGSQVMLSTRWFDKAAFPGSARAETPQTTPAAGSYPVPSSIKLPEPVKDKDADKKQNMIVASVVAGVIVLAVIAFFVIKNNKSNSGSSNNSFSGGPHTEPVPGKVTAHKLYLSCRGGYQDGRVFPIQTIVRIGRGMGNDISYPDDYLSVSRDHVTLTPTNIGGRPAVILKDTRSSNGTFLKRASIGESNVTKIQHNVPVELYPGDVFYLAEHANRFELIEK